MYNKSQQSDSQVLNKIGDYIAAEDDLNGLEKEIESVNHQLSNCINRINSLTGSEHLDEDQMKDVLTSIATKQLKMESVTISDYVLGKLNARGLRDQNNNIPYISASWEDSPIDEDTLNAAKMLMQQIATSGIPGNNVLNMLQPANAERIFATTMKSGVDFFERDRIVSLTEKIQQNDVNPGDLIDFIEIGGMITREGNLIINNKTIGDYHCFTEEAVSFWKTRNAAGDIKEANFKANLVQAKLAEIDKELRDIQQAIGAGGGLTVNQQNKVSNLKALKQDITKGDEHVEFVRRVEANKNYILNCIQVCLSKASEAMYVSLQYSVPDMDDLFLMIEKVVYETFVEEDEIVNRLDIVEDVTLTFAQRYLLNSIRYIIKTYPHMVADPIEELIVSINDIYEAKLIPTGKCSEDQSYIKHLSDIINGFYFEKGSSYDDLVDYIGYMYSISLVNPMFKKFVASLKLPTSHDHNDILNSLMTMGLDDMSSFVLDYFENNNSYDFTLYELLTKQIDQRGPDVTKNVIKVLSGQKPQLIAALKDDIKVEKISQEKIIKLISKVVSLKSEDDILYRGVGRLLSYILVARKITQANSREHFFYFMLLYITRTASELNVLKELKRDLTGDLIKEFKRIMTITWDFTSSLQTTHNSKWLYETNGSMKMPFTQVGKDQVLNYIKDDGNKQLFILYIFATLLFSFVHAVKFEAAPTPLLLRWASNRRAYSTVYELNFIRTDIRKIVKVLNDISSTKFLDKILTNITADNSSREMKFEYRNVFDKGFKAMKDEDYRKMGI